MGEKRGEDPERPRGSVRSEAHGQRLREGERVDGPVRVAYCEKLGDEQECGDPDRESGREAGAGDDRPGRLEVARRETRDEPDAGEEDAEHDALGMSGEDL